MGAVRRGRPLPLHPAGSVAVNAGVDLLETDEGGVVFCFGFATWCWDTGDVVGRRLAAVSLVETEAAMATNVAAAFGVTFETLRAWRAAWRGDGIAGLAEKRRGPNGPSKLVPDVVARIRVRRAEGATLQQIADEEGVDISSVRRALDDMVVAPTITSDTDLVVLAAPELRLAERQLARAGILTGAEPVICEGAQLPFAGALLFLPALAATGLTDAFDAVYSNARAAFYSLRSLVLALAFMLLLGEGRAEGFTRTDPVAVGRLLGLDRAPEVSTVRLRLEELAQRGRADQLLRLLAEHHLKAHTGACGLFYVDGHVRAYHGTADVQKAHLARQHMCAPAELDTWITDSRGDGVLVWSAEPGASLTGELRRATLEIRALVGCDATPTVAFDRGGWSPKLFAELRTGGFDILTYRKGPLRGEPRGSFSRHDLADDLGRNQLYWLSERTVRLHYKDAKNKSRHFTCRQITRLDPTSGHQTQILTTREDLSAAEVAYAMFSRWREENFFRYMRHNYDLDALDSYTKETDDPTRMVPNPKKKQAQKHVAGAQTAERHAERSLAQMLADISDGTLELDEGNDKLPEVTRALDAARAGVATAKQQSKTVPARVALGEIRPDAKRAAPERKRLHDAVRMAVYNATSSLARTLGPHYRQADDEGRMVLREAFRRSADLQIVGDELHVRLDHMSSPRRSRAIAGICGVLTTTETLYPGTELRLVYSVKGF
jgi:transposase